MVWELIHDFMICFKYAWSVIKFVFQVFSLNISLFVGGYKMHELLRSGYAFSAEMVVIALCCSDIFIRNSLRRGG